MPSVTPDHAWDFSPVFNLIQSLSHKDDTPQQQTFKQEKQSFLEPTSPLDDGVEGGLGLGDFNKIWDYLGVKRNVPPPSVPPFEASTSGRLLQNDRDAYASDSALYFPSSIKGVRWRDEETEGADLAETQPETPSKNGLTKNQRKKKNRRERKASESEVITEQMRQHIASEDFGSEAELENVPVTPVMPVKKAPVQTELPPKQALQEKSNKVQTANKAATLLQSQVVSKTSTQPASVPSLKKLVERPAQPSTTPSKVAQKVTNNFLRPAQVTPTGKTTSFLSDEINAQLDKLSGSPPKSKVIASQTPSKSINNPQSMKNKWLVPKPANNRTHSTPPEGPNASVVITNVLSTFPIKDMAAHAVTQTMTPTRKRHELLPVAYQTAADRNWSLLLKLLRNFPAERDSLLSPLQLSINRPQPNGIHVFVDASNILIGFHDALKRARGIPAGARVPRPDLSFHALALLLERRRPVTKRVLAGSTPEISAFEEARQVGYETCILDKVFKAKELTERQKRFARRAMSSSSERYYASGSASDGNGNIPSADALPPQQPKWIEQAVDEILHLKILESIVDKDVSAGEQAPTMVLATGDAAEAEYSPGFMKMVERALGKGWNVEVVAWGANISMGYRRMEKKAQWGHRFKIIELDDYAEELFGQSV